MMALKWRIFYIQFLKYSNLNSNKWNESVSKLLGEQFKSSFQETQFFSEQYRATPLLVMA